MPKQKQTQFLQPRWQTKKKGPENPETANEFLQVGVDFEEAGEKWRAGDAAKSLRFFVRAIDTYQAGLRQFPDAFDLAYNKARLQYEVVQQPKLLAHLSTPLHALLQTALESHQSALRLNQNNADLLFNTAQVLTSLADNVADEGRHTTEERAKALKLLQESLEFFQRCLDVQECQFNQAQEGVSPSSQMAEVEPRKDEEEPLQMDVDDEGGVPVSEVVEDEAWATVVEPVTVDSLLDTVNAQIETLTAICSLESSQTNWSLAWVEEYFRYSMQPKLSELTSDNTPPIRLRETNLGVARFRSALVHAAFRSGRIDLATYARELHEAFEPLDLVSDPQGLCDKAEAHFALAASAQLGHSTRSRQPSASASAADENGDDDRIASLSKTIWTHATTALNALTSAAKLPQPSQSAFSAPQPQNLNLARIHLRRGDCEILRLSLRDPPLTYALAAKSAATLLGNAALYYRMAGRQATGSISSGGTGSGGALGPSSSTTTTTPSSNSGSSAKIPSSPSASSSGPAASGGAAVGKDEAEEAYTKGLIVGLWTGEEAARREEMRAWSAETRRAVREAVEEMREEGVLAREGAKGLVDMLG